MEWLVDWGYLGLFIGAVLGATVLPFSSEVVLLAILTQPSANPYIAITCATFGNWVGSLTSYYIGHLGRWDWIERYLRVKRATLEAQQERIVRWGEWLALMTWLPIIGDVLAVALGFYHVNLLRSSIFMFIGKAIRYIIWALLYYLVEPMF